MKINLKRSKVIMLPAEGGLVKGDILLRHIWKGTPNECRSIWQYKDTVTHKDGITTYTTLNGSFEDIPSSFKKQHLYFIIDEKPSIGDWSINLKSPYKHMEVCKIDNEIELERYVNKEGNDCKKIIASTDKLNIHPNTSDSYRSGNCLPQPTQQFLEQFCKAGGIFEVDVEYDEYKIKMFAGGEGLRIKTNPTDNTIYTHLIEEKSMFDILTQFTSDFPLHRGVQILPSEIKKWIEENL